MNDYFIYWPQSRDSYIWGGGATAAGYTRVAPHNPYPPRQHPLDHHYNWATGRVLQSYQLVFITEGGGVFESAASGGEIAIRAGTLFVLFPGIWHRYAPDKGTGWVEQWIECRGPVFERAQAAGIIAAENPVLHIGDDFELLNCFEQCHAWVQRAVPGTQTALFTLGLHMLAILEQAQQPKARRAVDDTVQRAQRLIAQRYPEALDMVQIARELNTGYSHFRQAFKKQTGLSPKQYHLKVRLQKAQDLLTNTPKTIKEIAVILGFDSAYHLSTQFKGHFGVSPKEWRKEF